MYKIKGKCDGCDGQKKEKYFLPYLFFLPYF